MVVKQDRVNGRQKVNVVSEFEVENDALVQRLRRSSFRASVLTEEVQHDWNAYQSTAADKRTARSCFISYA